MPIPAGTRVVQGMLAVSLLLTSAVIIVPSGHGGFYVGQLVLFGPFLAVGALVVAAVLLILAWFVSPGILAICTTLLAAPALGFLLMVSERLASVAERRWRECLSIASERQRAANWLCGQETLYSDVTCDT